MKKSTVVKAKADKKASPIWLIIFLCTIVVGLVWLVSYGKHLGTTNLLNEEINRLNQELEQLEANKQIEIERLKETIFSTSSPSATSISTPSAQLKTKTSTVSAEKE